MVVKYFSRIKRAGCTSKEAREEDELRLGGERFSANQYKRGVLVDEDENSNQGSDEE